MGNPPARLIGVAEGRARALSKRLLGFEDSVRLSQRGKALGDPTRLILLQALSDLDQYVCVGDLTLIIEREQSGVSRHLDLLYKAGLLDRLHRYRMTQYRINAPGRRLLAALLDEGEDES